MEAIENYERLRSASTEQLQNFETDNIGIHWPKLDEDFSYEVFFQNKVHQKKRLGVSSEMPRRFDANALAFDLVLEIR